MTTLDLGILVVLGIGAARGLFTGVLKQAVGTFGLLLALWFGLGLMQPVGALVVSSLGLSEKLEPVLGFVVTFGVVLVGLQVAATVAQRALETVKLGFVNKLAGAAFGGLRAALLVSVLLLATSAVALPGGDPLLVSERTRADSVFYAPVAALAPAAWGLVRAAAPALAELRQKFEPADT